MKPAPFALGIAITVMSACSSNRAGISKASPVSGASALKTPASTLVKSPATLTFATVDSGDWAVVTHASGKATASEGSISVSLNDFTTRANPEIPARILGYRVCIAYLKSPTAWDMAACSNLIKHQSTLEPSQSETLDPNTVAIPASGLSEIGPFWFVIDIEVSGANQLVGHNYAPSDILH